MSFVTPSIVSVARLSHFPSPKSNVPTEVFFVFYTIPLTGNGNLQLVI